MSKVLKFIVNEVNKDQLIEEQSSSAFRFITVDAYISAIPFYEKNGFHKTGMRVLEEGTEEYNLETK